ncbi:MAG: 2-oxoacid:acceptor oxidoreductase family protein [Bacillota bacterium]
MYQVRFCGFGGEGVVKAADIMGKAAVRAGKWAHSLPLFGTEMRGAPVKAFLRMDEQPIKLKCYIYRPDAVVVTSPVLLSTDALAGVPLDGHVILNWRPGAAWTGAEPRYQLHVLDALDIALRTIGKPIINIALVGALVRVTGSLTLEVLEEVIGEEFSPELASKNIRALHEGYESVARW